MREDPVRIAPRGSDRALDVHNARASLIIISGRFLDPKENLSRTLLPPLAPVALCLAALAEPAGIQKTIFRMPLEILRRARARALVKRADGT